MELCSGTQTVAVFLFSVVLPTLCLPAFYIAIIRSTVRKRRKEAQVGEIVVSVQILNRIFSFKKVPRFDIG